MSLRDSRSMGLGLLRAALNRTSSGNSNNSGMSGAPTSASLAEDREAAANAICVAYQVR